MVNLVTLESVPTRERISRHRMTEVEEKGHYNITGISSDNKYVPLFACFLPRKVFNRQIIYYSLPKESNRIPATTYPSMYRFLEASVRTKVFKTKSMAFELLITKGAIFEKLDEENAELLFSIGVKEDYLTQMFEDTEMNKSKYVILVSSKLASDPKFSTIYRKLYKEVIITHLEQGIDIIITNNIVDKCFKNKVETPTFKSLTGMKEYLHAFNSET